MLWDAGARNGWITRIFERLGLKRGSRSKKNGGRPYTSVQTVDVRTKFNKDVELLYQSLELGDRVLSVAMFVNSIELRAADFHLVEVRPLQLDVVGDGDRRTRSAAVRKLQVWVTVRLYSPCYSGAAVRD
jgi:hypothetical protein